MKTAKTIPVEKTIELTNGVKLQYVEQGDPAGAPVLFLHGITDSWRSFEPVLPHLPHLRSCLCNFAKGARRL